ncbi:hypothetical protein A2311_02425 [candidate division WOR-1 bacterium RIFOXYB2_FULL_48_7]|uniref:aminomethyltransferase n=1 Tax=candidate division WOR-1 bacterium RIFOXYB2_FULL_48_7 TaxID=1802583 RepID=A0A1F4TUM7_UNCSA|nr:MAG: hypothetical protein A2311_02425 [candidate division WOR-1 bacterium RIFOXYB2_FULL_48_7]
MAELKRTPLLSEHLQLKAKIVPFAGWEMPVSYPAGIIAEHKAVRAAAGLFDIGHMGLIKLEGANALALINQLATNDASRLAPGQGQYSVLCNEAGGTIDDILVYRLPMFYLIIANASNTDKVLAYLKSAAGSVQVGLYENYCMISVQGPQAKALTAKILNAPLDDLKHNHTLWWRDIIISRTGYTGEDGFEFIVAKKEAAALWQAFINKGVQPCGLGARDTLRLEAGLPLYGHEYDEKSSPLDAGYQWAVKFEKGTFVGKKALMSGRTKTLVGLEFEGRTIPRQGTTVFSASDSGICGEITSGTFSPTFNKPLALAYLTRPESKIFVELRGNRQLGHVVDKAFYKRVK